ncbi:MAG: rhamnulokinase [Clostridiales bacterium]|nr:rhamnulokinase [Clostridiales bacterium]
MSDPFRVLAFDFGASSGRAIIGSFDGNKITLNEVHRFQNDPVEVNGTVFWDVLRLFYEIKQGLLKASAVGKFESVGIDTWGVDFGLLDKQGYLLENPVHYRDSRTKGLVDEAFRLFPKEDFYYETGIQFMELNTVFQLFALKKYRPELLERADRLLFMPDLLSYMLTGKKVTEYSIATTSQLVSIKTKKWSNAVFSSLGLPEDIFGEIIPSGTVIGKLSDSLCAELGIDTADVVSVCGHDTQSAITAVPSSEKDFIFLSSGTWSLFGTELEKPIVNKTSLEMNVTNEGGYKGSTGFLKNIIGLWLIQESRRHWNRGGENYSYADLERLALGAEPFKCFIDPDAPEFVPHGDIPGRVRDFCARTGQYVPGTVGEIMRCIYESLAMKYRETFEKIKDCTNKDYGVIHVIGGGTKDTLLCKMTSNACERTVKAGPIEATVLGNIAVQLMAAGKIKDISEARRIISESENVTVYAPEKTDEWREAYKKYLASTR